MNFNYFKIFFRVFAILQISAFLLNCGAVASKNGSKSTVSSVSDTTAPSVPGSLTATPGGSSQINLSWTAATDNTSPQNALVYEICQSSVSGGCNTFTVTQTTAAGATTASASNLNALTTYYFAIRAVDQAGNVGAASVEVSGTTDPAGVTNSPTFSPVAGVYGSVQNVAITSTTGGSAVCYTVDASTPSCNGSGACATGTLYSSAVNVAASQTINAIACASGFTASSVSSAAYTIQMTCTDGIKNASETDVDCGGPVCPRCITSRSCGVNNDCLSGFCTGGVCQ